MDNVGIVVEITRREAIVMTKRLEFLLVKREPQMASGQFVKINEKSNLFKKNKSK